MLKRLSLLLLLCLAGTFAYASVPTITTIAPTSGVVGTVVTITGTNLDKVTAVTFNGSGITTEYILDSKGNLKVHVNKFWADTTGFRYVIAVLNRAGVKSVDGVALTE